MRKIMTIVLICISSVLCLCRPYGFFKSDEQIAKENIENVLAAIQNEDHDKIKSMFSKSVLEQQNIDESIYELFEYFEGTVESYDDGAGPYVSTQKDDSFVCQTMESSVDIKTNICEYRIAMQYVVIGAAEDIGIVSIYIIKSADDPYSDYRYWGDGNFLPGIHIGVPHYRPNYKSTTDS